MSAPAMDMAKPLAPLAETGQLEAGDRFLTKAEVLRCTGMSSTTLYLLMRQGRFPRQVRVLSMSRWSWLEVQDWMTTQREARTA